MTQSVSVYVHLPWCEKKCPYCDFNSHPGEPDKDEQARYVTALLHDLAFETTELPRMSVRSVFIGGGTPSLFSARSIGRILAGIDDRMNLATDTEITLESNPGSAEARRFAGYRSAGVNRLSIGVQSFDNGMLRRLGRVHDAAQAHRAVGHARAAGFARINLDLMYGLPEQSREQAMQDLDTAIGLEPAHLSWYELTLEPGTAFGRRPPPVPDDDARYSISRSGSAKLRAAGFRRYEVSAWARSGERCQHNLNYWRFGDYLGIGAGAHGKLRLDGVVRRRAKLRSPQRYLAGAGSAAAIAREYQPSAAELRSEFALNALRLQDGFPLSLYARTTGRDPAELQPALNEAHGLGLARLRDERLVPTRRGRLHLNRLIECLA